jgi:hypothetical protein
MREMADEPADAQNLTVVRDPSFTRTYADNAAAFCVGRDVEMAFLVTTPNINSILGSRNAAASEVAAEAVFSEVCRIRMAGSSASAAAFNIIFALLQEGKLDADYLRTNIESMIAHTAPADDDEPGVR